MPFSQLGLNDRLVQGVTATGFSAPTEIQSRAIPTVLSGGDIIGLAQTGTGKTAAFVLPMLNKFSNHHSKERPVRGLVLTPTRELAKQIEDAITTYGRFTSISTLSLYGGVNMENQIRRLRRGVDIVIATPGRLLDHISRRTINLSNVEVLVLDEADRMFDMGFIQDVRKIVERIPQQRQTLLFSATMPEEIRKLTASIQKNPEVIRVGAQGNPAATITQHFYSVAQEHKLDLLAHILVAEQMSSVLVFSRTKRGADRISKKLERRGIVAAAMHSDRTQSQRQQALAGFKDGRFKVLVATDIAARGIDVEGISHVVNYDTPPASEDYVHRIGRTGRAAATGDAITFVSESERGYFRRINHDIGTRADLKQYPGFTPAQIPEKGESQSEKSSQPHDNRRNGQPVQHHRKDSGRQQFDRKRRPHGSKGQSSTQPSGDFHKRRNHKPKPKTETTRRDNRENRHHVGQQFTKSDWMALIEKKKKENPEESFGKKLKRIFKRD